MDSKSEGELKSLKETWLKEQLNLKKELIVTDVEPWQTERCSFETYYSQYNFLGQLQIFIFQ